MLVDIPFIESPNPKITCDLSDGGLLLISQFRPDEPPTRLRIAQRAGTGLYFSRMLNNFINDFSDLQEDKSAPLWPWCHFGETVKDIIHVPPSYGTADNLSQIRKRCRQYWRSPRTFVLSILIRHKEDAGWRWHKEGSYIGKQHRRCEYFKDEPKINSVISFNFMEVKKR